MDSLVIIPNERLKYATDQKITFLNAFQIADDVLKQAVQSISDLIKKTGLINLDFADVSAVMKDAGMAHVGVGRASGKNKAEEAARMAISSPLLETSIDGAKGVLVNFTGPPDMSMDEVDAAASLVSAAVHPDANIIFGTTFDESMEDEIRITVIATGFEDNYPGALSNKPFTAPAEKKEETAVTASPVSVHSALRLLPSVRAGNPPMTMATGMPSSRSLTKSADRIQNSIPMAGDRFFRRSPVILLSGSGGSGFFLAIGPRGRYNESYGTGLSVQSHGKGICPLRGSIPQISLASEGVICAVSSDPWSRKRNNETMQAAHRA